MIIAFQIISKDRVFFVCLFFLFGGFQNPGIGLQDMRDAAGFDRWVWDSSFN